MKILLDLRVLTKGKKGGIREFVYFFTDHLLKNDNENFFDLFYLGLRKEKLPQNWFKSNTYLLDLKIPNKIFNFSLRFFNLPKISFFSDAKIIYSPHFNILEKGKNQKRLLTVHDISFLYFKKFFSVKHLIWHWFQNFKKQILDSDFIFTVSNSTKKDLIEKFKIKEDNIGVLYPGINPIYQFKKELVEKKPYILYVGAVEPRKNLSNLIKAFNLLKEQKKFKDFKLIIVGFWGWLFQDVLKTYKNSPYKKDIIFTGFLEEEEVLKLYHQAMVFVYPSYFEGFGFPPLEAQKCGLPVIVSEIEVFKETLKNSALFVKPDNFQEIYFALEAILDNNKLKESLIKKGLENSQRFYWQKTIQEFKLWLSKIQ